MHDHICGSIAHPGGYILQEIDLDNISGAPMSEFFLDPAYVEII